MLFGEFGRRDGDWERYFYGDIRYSGRYCRWRFLDGR